MKWRQSRTTMVTQQDNPKNYWKQPIPCAEELDRIFHGDYRCMQLYKELIYRACNKDNSLLHLKTTVKGRDRVKTAVLMRGQALYGRKKYAAYLWWDDMTCDRAVMKLVRVYQLLSIQRNKNWSIVTIQNYDEVIGMGNQRASSEHPVSTSYSVKSVESDKEKNNGIVSPEDSEDNSKVLPLKGNMSEKEEVIDTINLYNDPQLLPYLKSLPNIDKTISQANGVFSIYVKYYREFLGKPHPNLKREQVAKAAENFSFFYGERDESFSVDWEKIIIHWFNCKPMETDFNINHFASGLIIGNRFWEVIYNDNCPRCRGDVLPIARPKKVNPIIVDPLFNKYREVYHGSEDRDVRAKISLEGLLESKFPSWKYSEQWKEANELIT